VCHIFDNADEEYGKYSCVPISDLVTIATFLTISLSCCIIGTDMVLLFEHQTMATRVAAGDGFVSDSV
jgi:hypothetical protein